MTLKSATTVSLLMTLSEERRKQRLLQRMLDVAIALLTIARGRLENWNGCDEKDIEGAYSAWILDGRELVI